LLDITHQVGGLTMRLPIESWLESQDFNNSIKDLFKEAIICYKAAAYRASLLFSYLGFQSVIKDRILRAEKPRNIHERAWEAIKNNLRKDEAWDSEVNECIKKSDENKRIFIITEDLRQQAIYWKYRRNDCAHSKQNIIESSHVESFWSFLYSNLPKFVVCGSKASLLQRIERHFDANFTKQEADFSHLIREVPNAVSEEETEGFLQKLSEIFKDHEEWYPLLADRSMKFLNELIKLESSISDKVIEFIKSDSEMEEAFFREFSEMVLLFYGEDPSGVRNLWRVKFGNYGIAKFSVFSSLIRNALLNDDKEEAIIHIIYQGGFASPSDRDVPLLKEHGYFEKYKEIVFNEENPLINQFKWGNNSYYSIGKYLDILGLDQHIVKIINHSFISPPFPFKMRDALIKYFSESPSAKTKYIALCKELAISPTKHLGF
jgi:hypothetical protein